MQFEKMHSLSVDETLPWTLFSRLSYFPRVTQPSFVIDRLFDCGTTNASSLLSFSLLHKSASSSSSGATLSTEPTTDEENDHGDDDRSENDGVCPYREYARLARLAPKNSITICTLHKILAPLGCSHNEIASCLFALDVRNVGYVHRDVFAKQGVDVIVERTKLERTTVEKVVAMYLETGMTSVPDCGIGLQLDA